MWRAYWLPKNWAWDNEVEPHLHVRCPNPDATSTHDWDIDSRCNNCGSPQDKTHRCWVRNSYSRTGTACWKMVCCGFAERNLQSNLLCRLSYGEIHGRSERGAYGWVQESPGGLIFTNASYAVESLYLNPGCVNVLFHWSAVSKTIADKPWAGTILVILIAIGFAIFLGRVIYQIAEQEEHPEDPEFWQ